MKKYSQLIYQRVLQPGCDPLKGQVHMLLSLSGKMVTILESTTGIFCEHCARAQNVETNPRINLFFIKKAAKKAAFLFIDRNTSGSRKDEGECAPHGLLLSLP